MAGSWVCDTDHRWEQNEFTDWFRAALGVDDESATLGVVALTSGLAAWRNGKWKAGADSCLPAGLFCSARPLCPGAN